MPKTRDCKVKMTEETAITIPDDVRAAFEAFDDDYLAEVLRPWDCDLKVWHDAYTILFRFETDDIVVWSEDGILGCKRGAVDTNDSADLLRECKKASIDVDACLCWLRDDSYSRLIGRKNASRELMSALA